MPVSEKQKASIRAWDKANMRTISCRLRTETANEFKQYCADIGSNPAAVLKNYINSCLDEYFGTEEDIED